MYFIKQLNSKFLQYAVLAASLCATVFSPLHADDTEIFFGQSNDAFETNPNIIFVLDVSGSMSSTDNTGKSRLNRMKDALTLLVEQSSNYNVGIMAFKGRGSGASVLYPVADLDSEASELCPDGVCPNETVFVRPLIGNDDATQNDQSLTVSLNDDYLILGAVEPETIEEVASKTTASNTFSDADNANLVTKEFVANSSAQENGSGTDDFRWRLNQLENDWFFENDTLRNTFFGYQFENIDIPSGSRITNASISLTLAGTNHVGDVSAFITGEQTAEPEPFPTISSGSSEGNHTLEERIDPNNRINKVVVWEDVPGTSANPADAGNLITTPNMQEILNEIIQLPSWNSGNTMSFIVSPLDDYIGSVKNLRTVYGAGSAEKIRPVLSVTYEELEEKDLPTQTTTVEATEHVDEAFHSETNTVWQNTTNGATRLFYVGGGIEPRQLALRFPNINIPKGAEIKSVFLRMEALDPAVRIPDSWVDWDLFSGTVPADVTVSGNNSALTHAIDRPIKLNIHAELSENPTADTDTPIKDRIKTTDFVTWEAMRNPEENGVRDPIIKSPDIGPIVQSAISLPEWQNGKTLSLIVAPDGAYENTRGFLLNVLTSQSNTKPTLEITYSVEQQAAENTEVSHTTAIRFRNVNVPPGATIEKAEMIMHASAANGDDASFSVRGEFTDNSKAFKAVNNDIGMRTPTQASITWEPDPWEAVGNKYTSVPITDIVSEITDQSNWCGGNSLTLMISGDRGNRFAQSVESDAVNAPALKITYQPSSVTSNGYCSNTTISTAAARAQDDGVQNYDSEKLRLFDTYLSTSRSESATDTGKNAIGLMFRGLQIPQGAEISAVSMEFVTARDLPDAFDVNISMQRTANAESYTGSDPAKTIVGRQYTNQEKWSHPGGLLAGDNVFTTDLTEMFKTATDDPSWTSGNTVAFKLEATLGDLDIVSNEGDESSVPRIIVQYQTVRESPGTQHRQQIQQTVLDMVAIGGTPLVSSYYEAAQYMRGGPVDYGTFRGFFANARLSHSGSYEGGTISRNNGCTESDLSARACRGSKILSTPTPPIYKTPINSQCQSNHIVLLSDGAASSNTAIPRIENLIGESCDQSQLNDERCGTELAAWLNDENNDHSSEFAGNQTVKTHSIGFNLSAEKSKFLVDIAANGGGTFQPAATATELLGAFKNIINNVSKRNASFVAPAASVSQFNRLRNSNDVYYAMFKPSGTARWQGNLKRYRIDVDANDEFTLLDSRGDPAVEPNSGIFRENSKSFWSTVTDGDNVELGGASEQLNEFFSDYTKRNVYTFNVAQGKKDLTDPVNEFAPTNTLLNIDSFQLPPLIKNDPVALANIIAWGKGADVDDENGDDNTTQLRSFMGDPMHSSPLVASYPGGESVIYMATNEGFLHAIDSDNGEEHFAFIPEDLYKNIYPFYQNNSSTNRPYGLDGGKTLWHEDKNNDGLIDKNETAILYVAMRRGGKAYFALDVSDHKKPQYLWSIRGGEISDEDNDPTTAKGDFSELASTWSLPVKTKVRHQSDVVDVLIFGGGYDQNQDPTADVVVDGNLQTSTDVRKQDSFGRAIFIVEAETGELLWKTDRLDPFSEMNYSIPSEVRVLDMDFDGVVDQLYVGDMGGQLWRMDFDNNLVSTETIDKRIDAGVIASIAGDTPKENRKFYYPPDVALINISGRPLLNISIGSGWRAHPLDDIVEDRIYNFRSTHVFGPPINSLGDLNYTTIDGKENAFIDVTDDINADVGADDLGWFLRLENSGEKVLGRSLTFNNQIILTSYQPSNTLYSCDAAIGGGSVYILNVFNGAPVENLDGIGGDDLTKNDRSRVLANPGLPPEVSILFPESKAGSSADGEPLFQVGKEKIDELNGGNLSGTTFWQEMSENHDE